MPTVSGITQDVTGAPCAAVIDITKRSTGELLSRVVSNATTGAYSATVDDTSDVVVKRYVAPVVDGDPNWDSVVLAMRFNGENNSIDFKDEKGHSFVAMGGAKISTSVSLIGGSSGFFDGTNDYLIGPASEDFDCGTSPFTLRGKFRYSGTSNSFPLLIGNVNGWAAGALALSVDHSFAANKIALNAYDFSSSTYLIASSSDVTIDTWYDFEIVRNGTSLKLFKDGVLESTVTISSGLAFNFALGGIRVGGGNWDGGNSYFFGNIQELELYKGVAVHSATFTPSSSAFLGGPSPGTPTENAEIFDTITPV